MRNVVTFDVRGVCNCACLMNVLDGSNNINLIFEVGEYDDPQIEIIAGETTTTTALTVENGVATFELKLSLFDGNEIVKTRFIDGEKIGKQYTWKTQYFVGIPDGYVKSGQTLRVIRETDDLFKLEMYAVNDKPATSYNANSFTVTDTGELTLKTPHEITVETNNDDFVTGINFDYGDDEINSFSVSWNDKNKISKFGDIPITWG